LNVEDIHPPKDSPQFQLNVKDVHPPKDSPPPSPPAPPLSPGKKIVYGFMNELQSRIAERKNKIENSSFHA